MDKHELLQFLKDNLKISCEAREDRVYVKLTLLNKEISSDYFIIGGEE